MPHGSLIVLLVSADRSSSCPEKAPNNWFQDFGESVSLQNWVGSGIFLGNICAGIPCELSQLPELTAPSACAQPSLKKPTAAPRVATSEEADDAFWVVLPDTERPLLAFVHTPLLLRPGDCWPLPRFWRTGK